MMLAHLKNYYGLNAILIYRMMTLIFTGEVDRDTTNGQDGQYAKEHLGSEE